MVPVPSVLAVQSWTPVLVQSRPRVLPCLLQLELLAVAVGEQHLPLGGRQGLQGGGLKLEARH